ncbi:peptide deformylase [Salinibacterium sp. NSLL150]|uniref:peptide deformylase n=1 Tax=unclassified Salinibacterium TaxID=2632331 RepID=UPI0018CEB657|nr:MULTISPECIES: peptide deformylase [unclassified Salinibacterium]MBH0023987.1 peptide deformylase [Salinibacterium sp. SWN248]MBH0098952.1 peptide deformylase [Salinibacterium sp. NSLL35]MBH0101707.1 peptide deformylase [Salinibacterium sp. NSLL150]MBH0104466.1 peptide deformylase [Salinibacterium sp. NSLL16]MBH0107227.1 peptide deformylase [Salinibacterium sp. NSLL17]
MAVLPIIITGDPVLHTPANPVTAFDSELTTLVNDMIETMEEAPGVGLAAPQVGVGLRIFVYDWTDDDDVHWHGVAINPELWQSPTPVLDADEADEEGCLSIPGERYPLARADRVILRAFDLQQQPFEIEASGWLARIFQHEYDHLDGVLYADRLQAPDAKAAAKAIRKQGWGQPGLSWLPTEEQLDA